MRDYFVADTHLNLSAYGAADRDGLCFRTKDMLAAGDWAVDQVVQANPKPNHFFWLGDIYEDDHPRNKVRSRFKQMLRRLVDAGIETHLLVGNHDACRSDHALESVNAIRFPGVFVHYAPAVVEGSDALYLIYPHCEVVERQTIGLRSHFIQTVREWLPLIAAERAKATSSKVVLCGHLPVFGAKDADGHQHSNEDAIHAGDLETLGADYVFLGDFHGHQQLALKNAEAYYVGSLERTDFRDLSSSKGMMSLCDGRAEFIAYPNSRPMVKPSGTAADIECQVDQIGRTNGIVKLCFVGNTDQAMEFFARREAIKQKLMANGAKIVLVESQVVDPVRDAQAEKLQRDIQNMDELGSKDLDEVMQAAIATMVADKDERKHTHDLFCDVERSVGEKRRSQGVVNGTLRLHGVRLHNCFRYGDAQNIVEFSKGATEIFEHPVEPEYQATHRSKIAAAKLSDWLNQGERKLISIIGQIDGDENESNGSGKSSIMDAISYAWFGKTIREFVHKKRDRDAGRSILSIVRKVGGKYASEAYVELLFSIEDSLWLVRRGRHVDSPKKHKAIFQIECLSRPAAEASYSGHRKGKSGDESLLAELIGMSYETFCNSSMFGQFDAGQFVFGTHSVRQDIIINVLRLGVINQYLEEVRERKKRVVAEIDGFQIKVDMLETRAKTSVVDLQAEIDKCNRESAALEGEIKRIEAEIDAALRSPEATNSKLKSEVDLQQRLLEQKRQEKQQSFHLSREKDTQLKKQIAEYQDQKAQVDDLKIKAQEEIQRIQTALKAFDPAAIDRERQMIVQAKQKRPVFVEEERGLLAAQTTLAAKAGKRSTILESTRRSEERIAALAVEEKRHRTLADTCRQQAVATAAKNKAFNRTEMDRNLATLAKAKKAKPQRILQEKQLVEQQGKIQTDRGVILADKKRHVEAKKVLQELLDRALTGQVVQCPHCRSNVSMDHLKSEMAEAEAGIQVLENNLNNLDKVAADVGAQLEDVRSKLKAIEEWMGRETEFNRQLDAHEASLLAQSQQEAATAAAVADADRVAASINQEREILSKQQAEVQSFQNLDQEIAGIATRIQDKRNEIAALDAMLAREAGLTAEFKEQEARSVRLEDFKKQIEEAKKNSQLLHDKIEKVVCEVAVAQGRYTEVAVAYDKDIAEMGQQLAEMKSKLAAADVVASQVQERVEKGRRVVAVYREDKEKWIARLATAQENLRGVQQAAKDYGVVLGGLNESKRHMERLKTLDGLLGPDGIQTSIVERYVPLLNSYLQEYLSAVSGNRLRAEVLIGQQSKEIEIMVGGDGSDEADFLSGGEGVKIRLALDIALGLLSFARSRNAPDFICLDEVLAPVDRKTKIWVFEMLEKLQDRFCTILLISHDEALQKRFRKTVLVNKVNGTSRIERQYWETDLKNEGV